MVFGFMNIIYSNESVMWLGVNNVTMGGRGRKRKKLIFGSKRFYFGSDGSAMLRLMKASRSKISLLRHCCHTPITFVNKKRTLLTHMGTHEKTHTHRQTDRPSSTGMRESSQLFLEDMLGLLVDKSC